MRTFRVAKAHLLKINTLQMLINKQQIYLKHLQIQIVKDWINKIKTMQVIKN